MSAIAFPGLASESIRALYTYRVPELGPGGACSVAGTLAAEPYDLRPILGVGGQEWAALAAHSQTLRLWRLKQLVDSLLAQTASQWLGVYEIRSNSAGERVLVKLAYANDPPSPSRAEFPLTEAFAETSNNSRVALTGAPVLIEEVAVHSGAYYQCDTRVQSEYCAPIITTDGRILGIIDAEAHAARHFTPERRAAIDQVCAELAATGILAGVPASTF